MKIDRIVGVVILTAVAQSAEAGTFLIDDVWQDHRQSILSETKMWAGAGASAHYDGTVDFNDNNWALEANLIIDGKTEFSSTGGTGGNTISAGMVVTCSELNCGASRDFEKCPEKNWSHYGVVVIYHQFSIEDDRKDGFMRLTECDPCADGCVDGQEGETENPPGSGTFDGSSPILIDLDRGGFRLTSLEEGVQFDLDADGEPERLSWTAADSGDAFLALDRNGNGRIDDGRELFGNFTPQPATAEPNGFLALGVLDQPAEGGNGDGVISGQDAVFSRLLLWRDSSHDGVSDGDEVSTLGDSGVVSIELDYVESRRRDRHGNELRYASRVRLDRASTQAVDVFFLVD